MQKILRETDAGRVRVFRPDESLLLPNYYRLGLTETDGSTYIINFGSGGSGKSYAQAQHFVKLCLSKKKKEKILVIRQTGASLAESVIAEFIENALPFWGLDQDVDYFYNSTKREIKFKHTGSRIIFKGLDNPEKLKSIPGVTRLWIEEATEISEKYFDIVNDRIRGNPKVYLTFNPISEQHWIKLKFLDRNGYTLDPTGKVPGQYRKLATGDISVIFSTFLENPYIGEKYIKSMKLYRKHNPDHFRVYGLGLWGIIRPEMPFFVSWRGSNHLRDDVERDMSLPSIYLSFDFNVNNTVVISQRDPGVWVNYLEVRHGGGDLKQMCQQIVNDYGRNTFYYFTGDGSGNNQSATSEGNLAAWQLIRFHFIEYGVNEDWLNFGAVPTANTTTAISRTVVNMMISRYGSNLRMSRDNCKILIDDIDRMESLPNGSLNKAHCNKYNYGHAGDAFRYDLQNFDGGVIYEQFGELIDKMLTSGNQSNYERYA